MLSRFFEPFKLLADASADDGLGGQTILLTEDVPFQGALTFVSGEEKEGANCLTLKHDPVLLHEFDVTLSPGDRVRRESTGDVYRVKGRSGDMRTPAFSGLSFAQVPVERWCDDC